MGLNLRKWNRILHRDFGYFFFGLTIIYSLSGIALNHLKDWNPSYVVYTNRVQWEQPVTGEPVTQKAVMTFLGKYGQEGNYKKHYQPEPERLKIFLKSGHVEINLSTGHGVMEKLKRRPVLREVNFLHYNPGRLWTWFSDVFCVSLILIAITGLFIVRGKNGITGRGAVLTGLGIAMPLILLFYYLN